VAGPQKYFFTFINCGSKDREKWFRNITQQRYVDADIKILETANRQVVKPHAKCSIDKQVSIQRLSSTAAAFVTALSNVWPRQISPSPGKRPWGAFFLLLCVKKTIA
jgi:hypothetical protein